MGTLYYLYYPLKSELSHNVTRGSFVVILRTRQLLTEHTSTYQSNRRSDGKQHSRFTLSYFVEEATPCTQFAINGMMAATAANAANAMHYLTIGFSFARFVISAALCGPVVSVVGTLLMVLYCSLHTAVVPSSDIPVVAGSQDEDGGSSPDDVRNTIDVRPSSAPSDSLLVDTTEEVMVGEMFVCADRDLASSPAIPVAPAAVRNDLEKEIQSATKCWRRAYPDEMIRVVVTSPSVGARVYVVLNAVRWARHSTQRSVSTLGHLEPSRSFVSLTLILQMEIISARDLMPRDGTSRSR